jgi:type II secretory pathway component PulF
MLGRLSDGGEFRISRILGEVMPSTDNMMLTALDVSKNKPDTLRSMAASLREQDQIKSVIIKGMVPPLILIPGIGAFCYVLATQTIPIMVKIAPPGIWKGFNLLVRKTSEFISGNGPIIAVAAVLLIAGFMALLPRWYGRARGWLEQVPVGVGLALFPVFPFVLPLAIYRDYQVSLLLTSMAVLLQSGMTLTEALKALAIESSPYMRWHLKRVIFNLQFMPSDYIGAFSRGLIGPRLLARISSSIRHTPHFDKLVIRLGTSEGMVIREQIAKVVKSVNFFLLVLLSSVVIFLYIGQFTISQDLVDAVRRGTARY